MTDWSALFDDDSFFLSKTNPTATVDQRDLEALALEVVKDPVIVAARAHAMQRFTIMGGGPERIPAEALEHMDAKLDEWAFHYTINALNSDPNYPKVLGHGYGPPHEWLGMKVPGCRGLGTAENPDNHYSFVPIDGNSRFVLHGKVWNNQDDAVGDCPIFLTSNLSQSVNVSWVDWRAVPIAEDGTFEVTIDPTPADGRPNHLQSSIDTKYLFIRDGRQHWDQIPHAYRIERLDPPTAPARSVEELTRVAARFIVDDVPMNFFFKQMIEFLATNSLSEVSNSSRYGGMQTQKLLRGKLDLADDEAFVLTLDSGGSDYWVLTLYDWWAMSGNFWSRTSCLNDTQTVANTDGTHTLVFSIADPGVHNWVDTLDLHKTVFLQRWQLMPTSVGEDGRLWAGGEPSATGELVKLADLKDVLPAETRWVTPEERIEQLEERYESFRRRHAV
jgi:hypothetical protein